MRGFSLLHRVGLAVAIGSAMVTPTFANTMGGGFWNQIVFSNTSFNPNNPATNISTFHNTGSWYTQTVQTYNNNAYTTTGFTPGVSEWVGSSTYQRGGWSIYYFDFTMATTSALSGVFSSDNTSFLMLDFFPTDITASGAGGSSSFTIDATVPSPGFLGYRPAVDPNNPNQNSFQGTATSFTSAVLAQGSSHRMWAIVRNDNVNLPANNPNAFRLEFAGGGGNTNPVPEPFTMALGAAGIGLAVRRRLKKSS